MSFVAAPTSSTSAGRTDAIAAPIFPPSSSNHSARILKTGNDSSRSHPNLRPPPSNKVAQTEPPQVPPRKPRKKKPPNPMPLRKIPRNGTLSRPGASKTRPPARKANADPMVRNPTAGRLRPRCPPHRRRTLQRPPTHPRRHPATFRRNRPPQPPDPRPDTVWSDCYQTPLLPSCQESQRTCAARPHPGSC